jgi:uncharacterized membrane protein YgcG
MGLADITVAKKKARRRKPPSASAAAIGKILGGSVKKTGKKAKRVTPKPFVLPPAYTPSKKLQRQTLRTSARGTREATRSGLGKPKTKAEEIKPWEKTLMDLKDGYEPTEGQAFRGKAGDFRTGFEKGLGLVTGTDPQGKLADNLAGIALTLGAGAPGTTSAIRAARGIRTATGEIKAATTARTAARTRTTTALERSVAAGKRGPKRGLRGKPRKSGKTKPTPKKQPTPKLKDKANVNIKAENLGNRAVNRYSAEERAVRRARRSERVVRSVTNPAVAVPTASDKGRAFVEGHLAANPVKAAVTTAQAIPATFAFGATIAGDAIEAAKTGDSTPLKGTLNEAKSAVTQLAPLVSGDADQVKDAIENDVGYVMAPLLPRGLASTPAKAAARAVIGGGKKAVRKVPGLTPEAVANRASQATKASQGHSLIQKATQRDARKRTAQILGEEKHVGTVQAAHAETRINKEARKIKDRRGLSDLRKDVTGEDVIPTLINFNIGRKKPIEGLRRVLRHIDPHDSKAINVRRVVEYVEANPQVLDDPAVWRAVDQGKKETLPHETSDVAKWRGQGQVLGVPGPERTVPKRAKRYTDATDRQEAWKDYEAKGKTIKQLRARAVEDANRADVMRAEVKGMVKTLRAKQKPGVRLVENPALNRKLDQLLDLEANVRGLHAEIKARRANVKALGKELSPYSSGARPPSRRTRGKDWDKEMADEYVGKVKSEAAKVADEFDDAPGWTSEPRLITDPGMRGGEYVGPKAVHPKTGKAARHDVADRSYAGWLHKTIRTPHIRKGLARGVRRFVDEMSEAKRVASGKIKRAFTADELADLHVRGEFDPRTHMAIPKRQIMTHLEDEHFDVEGFHSDITKTVRDEFNANKLVPGESYIIVKREAGLEFMDQVNPNRGLLEAITGPIGTGSSRILLNNPAWLASQGVATGFQALAAAALNPVALGREFWHLERLRAIDPHTHEILEAKAGGAGPSVDTPQSHRISGEPSTGSKGRRGLNSTVVGRRVDEILTQRTFGLMDRWQTGKWRTAVLSNYLRKKANKSERARLSQGKAPARFDSYLAHRAEVAEALRGKNRFEQDKWWAENPRHMDSEIRKLRDTMGDWHTYTRFEKAFAGLFIFYPFVRMSLTWPIRFAKHHPLVAESLYLLGQANNKELEKALGDEDLAFLEYANAVVHGGPDGAVSAVLPGARRFQSPGLNVVTEAVGSQNTVGVLRALNPAISAPLFAAFHTDPFTGQRTDESFGEATAQQAIAMFPGARALGLHEFGEPSPLSEELRGADPQAKYRSLVNPFDAMPLEDARYRKDIIDDLKASGIIDSEVGQFIALVDSKGLAEAKKLLRDKYQANKDLKHLDLPPDPEGDAEYEKLSDIFYAIKYGTDKKRKAKRTSSSTSDSIFGGGGGGGGSIFSGGSGGSGSIFSGGGGSGGSIFK